MIDILPTDHLPQAAPRRNRAPSGREASSIMTICAEYRLVVEDDSEFQRIIAVDERDTEIVGAYRTHQLNDWKLYSTKQFAEAVNLPQPSKVHVISRQDAVRWLDVLASFYTRAVSQ